MLLKVNLSVENGESGAIVRVLLSGFSLAERVKLEGQGTWGVSWVALLWLLWNTAAPAVTVNSSFLELVLIKKKKKIACLDG